MMGEEVRGAYASCQRSINSVDLDDTAMPAESSAAGADAANVESMEVTAMLKN
jgi:hypothetical protein